MGDQGAFRALRSNHKSQLRDLEQQTADRRLEDRDKQADARRASPKSSNIAVFTDVNMVGPRTPYKEVPPGSSRATKNTPNNTGKTGAKNASELKESSPSKKSSTSVLSTPRLRSLDILNLLKNRRKREVASTLKEIVALLPAIDA
ncbi:hypothetical protein SLS60_005327 [Paraconiothyrium brasiliense]|uniref:Uncharacterized protein n=1 Tax=Paraconiothyrium brasiliense TaxID=300254 RepID=A0ABR3RH94_9PLEO